MSTPITALDVARWNMMEEDYRNRPLAERMEEAEQKKAAADKEAARKKYVAENLVLPRKLWNNSTAMGRFALSCSLFGFGRGERANLQVTLPTFGNGRVHYEGPELRQDDLAVLEGLISLTRDNELLTEPLRVKPAEFCVSIGWSKSSSDKQKLLESITRMRKSDLHIVIDSKNWGMFHLIGDIGESEDVDGNKADDGGYNVCLSPTIRRLFAGGMTFLPLTDRQLLTDGLQTWLAGFLRAWRNVDRFSVEDLYRYSGSKQKQVREFGRDLKDALKKLQAVGIIQGFESGRGWVEVTHKDRNEE
jgi:hypothetical protein